MWESQCELCGARIYYLKHFLTCTMYASQNQRHGLSFLKLHVTNSSIYPLKALFMSDVWHIKINSCSNNLLMTCTRRTRDMNSKLFFSLIQWLDCRAWSKNIAKEKPISSFFVWGDILLVTVCRNCLPFCFFCCAEQCRRKHSHESK